MKTSIRKLVSIVRHAASDAVSPARFQRNLDLATLALIVASVLVVMADSVKDLHAQYGDALYVAEWAFTLLFTAEYLFRLLTAPKPIAYARSFFGIVDLVSVLPTYLAFFFPGSPAHAARSSSSSAACSCWW